MNTRRTFAFGFVAALLSLPLAATAEAASRRRGRHMARSTRGNMAATSRRSGDSESSAVDALNAQSLSRARGGDQGMPQGQMGGQGGMPQGQMGGQGGMSQ